MRIYNLLYKCAFVQRDTPTDLYSGSSLYAVPGYMGRLCHMNIRIHWF